MSQYSNPQTPTKLEVATSQGGSSSESIHPNVFNGTGYTNSGAKIGAVTAGSSSKVSHG
jgi:hypothetical protein